MNFVGTTHSECPSIIFKTKETIPLSLYGQIFKYMEKDLPEMRSTSKIFKILVDQYVINNRAFGNLPVFGANDWKKHFNVDVSGKFSMLVKFDNISLILLPKGNVPLSQLSMIEKL